MGMIATQQDGWATFYSSKKVTEWQLPAATQDDLENGIFRRLFVRWSELLKASSAGGTPPMWFLCCDVLELDMDVVLDRTAIIFARRIEISNNAELILGRTDGNASDLLLFTQEIVDKATGAAAALGIVALTPAPEKDPVETAYAFKANGTAGACGLYWSSDAAQPKEQRSADLESAYLIEGEPLRLMLVTTFQLATLLSTENVPLSLSQLRWVGSLGQTNKETLDLALQATSLANTLLAEKAAAGRNALLVPRLDNSVYASASSAFMELLRERQARWEALQRMKIEDTNWANAARDSLDSRQNEKDLADKLESQALASRQQALRARNIATKQVVYEKTLLAEREILFEAGIKQWKENETRKELINIVTGVFEILKEVPTIVAAGPEMAALPAVQTVQAGLSILSSVASTVASELSTKPPPVQGPKTREEAEAEARAEADAAALFGPKTKEQAEAEEKEQAKAAAEKEARQETQNKLASSLATAGSGAKKIVDAAMRISEIAQAAATMESSSRAILSSIGETVTGAFSSVEVQGLDVVTGGSQEWDLLGAAIEDTFENFGGGILKSIEGGTEYRLEFRKLVISGKALSQARLAVAKANSQLAEMKLRSMAAEKAIAIANRRVDQLGKQVERDQTLAQFAFNKVLDAKRAVYLALEAYRRAFLYFTLVDEAEVPALPRLTDTVDRLSETVARVSSRLLTYDALDRPPQTMNDIHLTVDPSTLSSLEANKGIVTWILSPDHPVFAGLGRVRFTRVRVFAEGLQFDGPIEVQIATSGVYVDKLLRLGATRQFVSQPMRINFVYDGQTLSGTGSNLNAHINVDGDIAQRYRNDFFNPTPFTTWTFRIKAQGDDETPLDFKSVTSLNVRFFGEATAI